MCMFNIKNSFKNSFIMPLRQRQTWPEALCFQVIGMSVCPILVNVISQAPLEEMSCNLAQTSPWTQGCTD